MEDLQTYWESIPVGRENAATYEDLCTAWACGVRAVRVILQELSAHDNGDNYILIRSSGCKGFYKTDDESEIQTYKREVLSRGRNVFAPVKKINRVLSANTTQTSAANNLRLIRESRGFKQSDVCEYMKQFDRAFDKPLLSKMENDVCAPTLYQLSKLALLFDCEPSELLAIDWYK